MRRYEIPGEPIAWTAHRGFGKKSYSVHHAQKQSIQILLRSQHEGLELFSDAISVDFFFEMPIPKHLPKKLIKKIDNGNKVFHTKRKDLTNCIKFAEDCLTGVVIKDDNIVCETTAQKYYSHEPRTIIYVKEISNGS